ncbi:hypothetical protein PUN28_005271 [Cardiocondyla obscurior]|uniref:Uncharacterized protein n=1 Tax=Cardiocondyla obscurior TaxID=286306 RepID=A0AAW2GGW4_9HYME
MLTAQARLSFAETACRRRNDKLTDRLIIVNTPADRRLFRSNSALMIMRNQNLFSFSLSSFFFFNLNVLSRGISFVVAKIRSRIYLCIYTCPELQSTIGLRRLRAGSAIFGRADENDLPSPVFFFVFFFRR